MEYSWWKKGSEWFLETQSKDVWGKEYQYFRQLDSLKGFETSSSINLMNDIKGFYKKLSKFVHGGATSFQTRPNRISPEYLRKEFNEWKLKSQVYSNQLREIQEKEKEANEVYSEVSAMQGTKISKTRYRSRSR